MAKVKRSDIDLLHGKSSFSDEPLWYRVFVLILQVGFLLMVAAILS